MSADGLDLDALAKLDQAATDRPWEASDIYGLVRPSQIDGWTQYLERTAADNQRHADIHLVAATRNALPTLIAAVRERDALVDGLRGLIQGATLADDDDPIGWISTDALRDLLDRTTGTDDGSS